MPTCYTCGDIFQDWQSLAEHVLDEHPRSKGFRWAEEFVRKNTLGGKARWEREERESREREAEAARRRAQEARSRWGSSGDNYWKDFGRETQPNSQLSLQQQAIAVLTKLYEYNMTEGEIQVIVTLAKRKAKK